jgi:hypothetical protein
MGWDYQIHNEPILNLTYEYKQRLILLGQRNGACVEAIPSFQSSAGNALANVMIGGQARMGINLPQDFGTTQMQGMAHLPSPHSARPVSEGLGLHVYGSAYLSAVLRNITLDGNTFREGPRVDKLPFVPAAEVGIGIATRHLKLVLAYVVVGKEFKTQRGHEKYGSLGLAYTF